MTKTEFTLLVNEMLNEYDCLLSELVYYDDGLCKVSYTDGIDEWYFYVAYRFMNRARLKLKLLDELDLLVSVDPELDLGF